MSNRIFRYFFDFMDGQEKWLNHMVMRGFRLRSCGKMSYVFDECGPDEYEYTVEFVGDKSNSQARDYQKYLEEMGFRTFTKNINLNFSFGKLKWRPYAKGMGQIATSPGSYNKELLILEKRKDGKPFELHTDIQDKLNIYKVLRRLYTYVVLSLLAVFALTFTPDIYSPPAFLLWSLRGVIGVAGSLCLIPAVRYFLLVREAKEEGSFFE